MTTAEQRQAELEVRLTNGYTRIGEAMQRGHDTGNWERVWIELLREYEAISDELRNAPMEQQAMALGVRREWAEVEIG